MRLLPTNLLSLPKDVEMAVDTETSGLHPDDGARVSTVSIAWLEKKSSAATRILIDTENSSQEIWSSGITTVGEWFEHNGERVRIISCAWPFDQGVDGTGKPEDTGMVGLWDDTENLGQDQWAALMNVLCGRPLIMHNAKFDCMMIKAGLREYPSLWLNLINDVVWDTMVGCSLLYPRFNNALKGPGSVTYDLWGAESSEEQKVIKEYLRKHKLPAGRWDLMPWSIIAKYAEQDAILTLRLKMEQRAEMVRWVHTATNNSDPLPLFGRRMEVMRMLFRVEQRGLPYDVECSLAVAENLKTRIEVTKESLPFQPATLNAAKDYWFLGADGLLKTPYATTEKGAPSVDASVIRQMVQDKIPGAKEWGMIQEGQTANSRWYTGYPGLCGSDGRLRGSLRQFGTVSHRFSIERVQLQAIPQDYRLANREILSGLPSPRKLIRDGVPSGLKLWDLDLANAELRIAALYAKCDRMLALINTGADVHGETARELFKKKPGDDGWEKARHTGKVANFSLIFDVGWETFQEMVYKQTDIKLSQKEARRIVREWKALYPEFKIAADKHMKRVDRRKRNNNGLGWIESWNGERRWYGKDRKYPTKDEETHSAWNQRVQMALGQFAIEWWLSIEKEGMRLFEPTNLGLGLVMMVHDSADILVPDNSIGDTFIKWCQEEGVRIWERIFPGVPGGVDIKEYGT